MIIGSISFALGLAFFAASVGFAPTFLRSGLSLAVTFLLFILSLIPFLATFTKLGLNGEEESDENRKILSKHLPHWDSVPVGAGIVALVLTMLFPSFIHPVYAFMAYGSFLSAYWFLHVYPVARKTLAEPNPPADPKVPSGRGSP